MRRKILVCALGLVAACSNTKTATKTDAPMLTPSAAASADLPAPAVDAQAGAEAPDASPAAVEARPDASAPPLVGANLIAPAGALFRVAACGGAASTSGLEATPTAVPAGFDAAMIDAHCKALAQMYVDYKKNWMTVAMPFIARLVPKDAPRTVVYPFGGGDAMGALATYPDATEYTTISLEIAADVRKATGAPRPQLRAELARYRAVLGKYFDKAHSRTDNLDLGTKSVLPGEVVFDLVALVLHGYEPLSVRYFRFADDGSLVYVTDDDLSAADVAVKAKRRKREDVDGELLRNLEIVFRKKGDASAEPKTLRHIAMNLDDVHLRADPRVLKHLEAKGPKVATMTKAASHLLWSDSFSVIRDYLATHSDWMISDSTGFTPAFAKKAGFVQDTYGTFTWPEPFGLVDQKNAEAMRKLFLANPHVDVSFRYGYPDKDAHGHILVSRKPSAAAAQP
jgi:hypothetical protein